MIIVDVETTGTNSNKHSLVSIGAIDFLDPSRTFHEECRIWEGAHVMEEALAVNGSTQESITDPVKKSEAEITALFFEWAMQSRNHMLAGQNPLFDIGFLQQAAERAGLNFPVAHRSLDQHTVAYVHMLGRSIVPPVKNGRSDLNSDMIMEYVGIPAEPKPHIALNGAIWEAEAFSRLLYDRPLLDQFKNYPIPWK